MITQRLLDLLDLYKKSFTEVFLYASESYKWKAVQHFQNHYDEKSDDFHTMLKDALSKTDNLIDNKWVRPRQALLDWISASENNEVKVSDLFKNLLAINRSVPYDSLESRIAAFRNGTKDFNKKFSPDMIIPQDVHCVSVYLSLRHPDLFYIYRFGDFKKFLEEVGDETIKLKQGGQFNYRIYLEYCKELNAIIKAELTNDEQFKTAVNCALLDNSDYYNDPAYHMLTQDFIYSVVHHKDYLEGSVKRNIKSIKKAISEYNPIPTDTVIVQDNQRIAIKGNLAKIDYAKTERENAIIGKAGEELVVEFEKMRLISDGRKDLAELVERISEKTDSLGYDILSFDKCGNELYIEVKTTAGAVNSDFYISWNELEKSKECSEKYRLYRVYDLQGFTRLMVFKGSLEPLCNTPQSYRVSLK